MALDGRQPCDTCPRVMDGMISFQYRYVVIPQKLKLSLPLATFEGPQS
jgi:hypothetical protein